MINLNRFYSAGIGLCTFQSPVPAPMLRRGFSLERLPETAPLTVCAPGFYELYVNGRRVTRGRLCPYISNPDEFLCCDSYDIAPFLRLGKNAIGLLLGNGVINCVGGAVWDFDLARYRAEPCFAIDVQAGNVAFDASVFVCRASAIVFNDLRAGEWYDARLETIGWTEPDYDDSDWKGVVPVMAPRGEKRDKQSVPPVLAEKELKAVSFRHGRIGIPAVSKCPRADDVRCLPDEIGEGILYDFGENTTGVCRLTLRGARPGQKIILQYGEILGDPKPGESYFCDRKEDSGLDLRGFMFLPERYNHRDVYICRGDEVETWEPLFTCHGFRYCLVIGLDDTQACADTLTAVVLHTFLKRRASFSCSDETANLLWEAGIRTDLGNICHIPTDCPHREKNGWTGDAALSAEQMLTVLQSKETLAEWLAHVRRSMREDGSLPGIVPSSGWGMGGFGPCWDGVIVELPYRILTVYGDEKPARESAASLMRYLRYLSASRNERGLIDEGLGDWCQCARDEVDMPTTPRVFTSTVTAFDCCRKAAYIFEHLNMPEEAAYAQVLSGALKTAVRRELLDVSNAVTLCNAQTGQAMAIAYDIFEPAEKPLAAEKLVQMIHDNGDFFDCGVIGLRVIFRVLGDAGYAELAWKLITRPEFPSYGYWIANGATTYWELFSPIENMQSSCNHHFAGDILCFFLYYAAGLRDVSAHKEVVIRPAFIKELSWAKGSVDTAMGTVSVYWTRTETGISLNITLPEGVSARVLLGPGMKTDEGFASLTLKQSAALRLIDISAHDNHRRHTL